METIYYFVGASMLFGSYWAASKILKRYNSPDENSISKKIETLEAPSEKPEDNNK